jgi:hypothetical protein
VGGGAVRRRQHGVVAPETREPQETVRSLVPPVALVDQCSARADRVLAMHTLSSQAQRTRPLGARQRLDRTANVASGGPQPAKQTPPCDVGTFRGPQVVPNMTAVQIIDYAGNAGGAEKAPPALLQQLRHDGP